MKPETVTETMNDPAFTPEQLPELWQQAVERTAGEPAGEPITGRALKDRWRNGIEAMYLRCETYLQHTKLALVLSRMPDSAWCETVPVMNHAIGLLKQAAPEQIQQALAHNKEDPGSWWLIYDDILRYATVEQLTGAVIAQLPWNNRMADWATKQETGTTEHDLRRRHIVEQIQQQLLGGNKHAWDVFCGIAEHGTPIDENAELALAIEHQHRPTTHRA